MLGFNMSQIQNEYFRLNSQRRGSKGERKYNQKRDDEII